MEPLVYAYASFPVRTVTLDNEPWFVAKDVCDALGIQNPTQAIERLDGDERSMFNIGRQGDTNLVFESGMYTLVLRCRQATTEGTERFGFWYTSKIET
ncbi:Bro-N domain-containing protein [Salmonella enterica subsp. enterica]|nr:Bro-N domain-containing protein [Salmonella enterica subsp. enterica]